MPLPQQSGILGRKRAAHLLRRITFGPNKAEIDAFTSYSVTQALDLLFQDTAYPLPPVDPKTNATWVDIPSTTANSSESPLQEYFKGWWLKQMLAQDVAESERLAFMVREKILFFIHTHLTIVQGTVNNSRAFYFQNALFRNYALDGSKPAEINLRELTKKISTDNAMLILLDGRQNVKGDPNENYSRELIELFTIGKGLPGFIPNSTTPGDYIYYTEKDVRSAAYVLSGWDTNLSFTSIDPETLIPRGRAKSNGLGQATQHDNSTKTFSARFNNGTVIPDPTLLIGGLPTEESMIDEISQLIDLIYDQPECPKNICRKLYRFFVYHEIDQQLDDTIITDLAATFVANGYKIEPLIREILGSQHFFDMMDASSDNDKFGALIKSPLELITETLLFFEYKLPDYTSELSAFYKTTAYLFGHMKSMNMDFMNAIDVAGYDPYHQFPIYNRGWISTTVLNRRYDFIFLSMTTENMKEGEIRIDVYEFIKLRFGVLAIDPNIFIREFISYLLPLSEETTEITTDRINYFKLQFFQLGEALPQGPEAFWNFSWANGDTLPISKIDARGMLQDLINAVLQSPEFQLH